VSERTRQRSLSRLVNPAKSIIDIILAELASVEIRLVIRLPFLVAPKSTALRRHSQEEAMIRSTRITALAALLVPLATACSNTDRSSAATGESPTGSTTTASTGATPTQPETVGSTSPSASSAPVAPSYADAERAFHFGRYEEAASMFGAYTESNPDNAWGQYMLGLSAWKTGDHTRALEAFDAALRLEPNHRKSLLNSARVLLETNRPQDALGRVERALAIEPLSSDGLRLAGRAHAELGQFDQAIDAYQRALALDDRDVWAMNNLGYLYIQQGRSGDALLPLARAVELRGNVPVFQNNFGTALERSGHFVAAREAYEAALAADSTYGKAATALERVTAHQAVSDSGSVDPAELSRQFQAAIEQWRTRPVTGDSSGVTAQPVTRDSAGSTPAGGDAVDSTRSVEMVRDSGQ
jgi:predicted Zn-dependent protease